MRGQPGNLCCLQATQREKIHFFSIYLRQDKKTSLSKKEKKNSNEKEKKKNYKKKIHKI